MNEEVSHFSLRKLSVGLASVLVGVSIFGTSQTVKADTVANSQVSTVTSNAQSFDTQKNENAVKSSFSSDNQANNAKSNLIQTQVEAKKDQKQDSVPKTQEVNDSSNLDAEKSIVGSSSTPKINNQSNDHAENNSQTQLDITKNSQQLNQKELATNLTKTQNTYVSNQKTYNDPSKIPANKFADGTRWTIAGWTRTPINTKIAKSSSLEIADYADGHNDPTVWTHPSYNPAFFHLQKIGFTLDKNDLKKGNKILVGTVQVFSENEKQVTDGSQLVIGADLNQQFDIKYNDQVVGNLTFEKLDSNELDLYFNSKTTLTNLIKDPNITYNLSGFAVVSADGNGQSNYKNHVNYIATNSYVREYDTVNLLNKEPSFDWYNKSDFRMPNWAGLLITDGQHQLNPTNNYDASYVAKIQPLNDTKLDMDNIKIDISSRVSVIDANGNPTSEVFRNYDRITGYAQKAQDNLSSLDLWNITPTGQAFYSMQKDGSALICVKQQPNADVDKIDLSALETFVRNSHTAQRDSKHRQQIIDNTLNQSKGWSIFASTFRLNTRYSILFTDVTPAIYSKHGNLQTSVFPGTSSTGQDTTDLETYKNVKISYVDDDDNSKSVSSDAMTGRQNKASTYTVNIPKGYYLDDNNTSKGYTWNADHTAISYTFNEDQAKNDANPIEIHLKHKHTAITDSSQLQTTGKRTIIVYLPHQDQPMIIVQTVGYKRTGDLDEATNTPTYTDWKVDADTSNVTVDGQPSTQYQAYVLKDGVVNYATIKLPHINGYKVKLIQDKANPAMFMVSFMAMPEQPQNNQSPQKPAQTEQNQPEPIQTKPADDKQVDQLVRTISYTLMHNDSSNTADSFEPAQTDSAPLETADVTQKVKPEPTKPAPIETQVPVETHDSLSNYTLTTNDPIPDTRVFNNIESNELTWQIVNKNLNSNSINIPYNLTNTIYKLHLPRFSNYELHLVKRGTTQDSVSFVYINKQTHLNYVFNLKIQDNKYYLTANKIDRVSRKIMPIKTYNVISYQDLLDIFDKYFK